MILGYVIFAIIFVIPSLVAGVGIFMVSMIQNKEKTINGGTLFVLFFFSLPLFIFIYGITNELLK